MTNIETLGLQHFQLVADWLSKPEINQWLTSEWRDRTVTSALVAMAVRSKRNRLYLARHDGRPCGLTAIAELDTADSTAMVWYLLGDQTLSGRGIISEALRLMILNSFSEFRLEGLYAWAMANNSASIRVLQKVGFREVGRMRRAAHSRHGQVDRIYFDLVANECNLSL